MFKSKHSGWTWDLKRTPFGGGGFLGGIADTIRGAGDRAADWTTENGWMIPVAMIGAGAGAALGAGAAAGEGGLGAGMVDASGNIIGAGAEGASMGAGATTAGQAAYDSAIASGATQSAAQAAADAAYNSYLTIGGPGQAAGLTAGEDLAQLMQTYPNLSQSQLESIMQINYGSDPMLSADAANLASQGYNADTINQVLGYSYSNPELAGTGIESSALNPSSGLNLSDSLKTAKRATDVAKLLKQGAASGLTSSIGKLAAGANPMGAQQLQVVRGNQNPFTYQPQQPIQDTRQAQLASLLKQG